MRTEVTIIVNSERYGPWAHRVNLNVQSPGDEYGKVVSAAQVVMLEARKHMDEMLAWNEIEKEGAK